jgi:transcriptional regulator with GAF, ATPase, and Fis domain
MGRFAEGSGREALTDESSGAEGRCEGGLLGRSPEIEEVRRLIDCYAASDRPVLIQGETGVGKELAAKALAERGSRRGQPFLTINCAGLGEQIGLTELFGHARGAFTDAREAKQGLFVAADGGTLFLDEVGELSERVQAELLRTVESGEVRPVGMTQTLQVRVRLVCATNRDLAEQVRERRFRLDLLQRIDVLRLNIPPLRARRGDVTYLAEQFLERRACGRTLRFAQATQEKLERHRWPGNVRELINAIDRAVVVHGGRGTLQPEHLELHEEREPTGVTGGACRCGRGCLQVAGKSWEESCGELLRVHLGMHDGCKAETARALKVPRTSLHRWILRYQVEERRPEGSAAARACTGDGG